MSLGFVVGESKPNVVTVQSSRALPIGEYVIIEVDEGKIVGLVETSFVTSAALSDVKNFDEAEVKICLSLATLFPIDQLATFLSKHMFLSW